MARTEGFTNVSRIFPCPICGATDRCSVVRTKQIVLCRSVDANSGDSLTDVTGQPYWKHYLGGGLQGSVVPPLPDAPPIASAERLNKAYRAYVMIRDMLAERLTDDHYERLKGRGFSDEEMERRQYRSNLSGELRVEIAGLVYKQLRTEEPTLLSLVPGFYQPKSGEEEWDMMGGEGILIPVLDVKGQIVAYKLRLDQPGLDGKRYRYLSSASRGGPPAMRSVHFPAKRWLDSSRVRITEGELKADYLQAVTRVNTLSLPGVNAFRQAVPALRELAAYVHADRPMDQGIKTVVVAFDADVQRKRQVAFCLKGLVDCLRDGGYTVEIETWTEALGKGLDDLLMRGDLQPTVLAGEAVDQFVQQITADLGIKSLRQDVDEMMNAVVAAKSLLPIIENAEWRNMLYDISHDNLAEMSYIEARLDATGRSWTARLTKVIKGVAQERAQKVVEEEIDATMPTIEVYDRNVRAIASEAIEALVTRNVPPRLFDFGGRLSQVQIQDQVVRIDEVSQADLQSWLDHAANWRESRGKAVQVSAPQRVAQEILSGNQDFSMFPGLRGVVHAPIFTADGALIVREGYHSAARLIYHPIGDLDLEISTRPALDDVRRAVSWVEQYMFRTMPWVTQASRANAWGLFLLPFVREMIGGPTPLHVINSPRPGTGKGLLHYVCTYPFALDVAATVAPKNETEWEKKLLPLLCQGPSHVYFDNVSSRLDSGPLALALTETSFVGRKLGQSSLLTAPIRCAWSATGNNVEMSQEIARRTVWIDLDANVEDPHAVKHAVELRPFIRANRSGAVWAALTCIRWWIESGCRRWAGATMGSYEQYVGVIGGILYECEISGFLDNVGKMTEEGYEDLMGWHAFISEWYARYGNREVTVRELTTLADVLPFWGDFAEKTPRALVQSFGKKLERKRNQVFLGKKLMIRKRGHQNAFHLDIVHVGDHGRDLRAREEMMSVEVAG